MKSIDQLARDNVWSLKPCVHGAEILGAAQEIGLNPGDIVDFSSSINPLGPSKKALVAAKKAFNQIASYPDSCSNKLRDSIAGYFGLDRCNIIVGNGSTEIMYLFAEAFIKRGETVVIPAPTFGEYEAAVCKAGGVPKFVKLERNFSFNLEAFKLSMAGAKLVFLCNPNNPTSLLIPNETLKELIETALNQDILVFLDEDFLEFVDAEKKLTMIRNIKEYPNLFVLRSFTKIFGLTGLRIGYGLGSREIVDLLFRVKIPWNVNCLAQAAASAALADEAHLEVTRELIAKEKKWLSDRLKSFKLFKIYSPDANFFLIDIRNSGLTSAELRTRLLQRGILIRDCSSFRGLDQFYIRIAVKTHAENEQIISGLKKALNRI